MKTTHFEKMRKHILRPALMLYFRGVLGRADRQAQFEMKKQVALAKELVFERKINTVEHLNIGDLATFMEVSMPMALHTDYRRSQYPNLDNCLQEDRAIQHSSPAIS